MILLPPFIMITLVAIIFYNPYSTVNYFLKPPAAVAADPPSHQKCQQLWIYTQPVKKGLGLDIRKNFSVDLKLVVPFYGTV